MLKDTAGPADKSTARIAGCWYLAMAVTGGFGMMYVPSRILVPGDASATAANLLAHESLFRAGIASSLLCQVVFVFLALALYRLFREVDRVQARLMVALVLASVPAAYLNMLNQFAPLVLLKGGGFREAFPPDQLQALGMAFLELHKGGILIVQFFWGLWLVPFGILVLKSGFIPRFLGVLLLLSAAAYAIDSAAFLLLPGQKDALAEFLQLPMALGELAMILWLLAKGVKGLPARTRGESQAGYPRVS